MPPGFGETLSLLLNLGGIAVGLVVAILVIVALIRGDLVPGHVYRTERKRGDEAEARLDAAKAKDEAAAAAAEVAERAAAAVLRLQHAGRTHSDRRDEPA